MNDWQDRAHYLWIVAALLLLFWQGWIGTRAARVAILAPLQLYGDQDTTPQSEADLVTARNEAAARLRQTTRLIFYLALLLIVAAVAVERTRIGGDGKAILAVTVIIVGCCLLLSIIVGRLISGASFH